MMSPCCWWGVEVEAAVAMAARVQMGEEAVGYPAGEAAVASCQLEEGEEHTCNHESAAWHVLLPQHDPSGLFNVHVGDQCALINIILV